MNWLLNSSSITFRLVCLCCQLTKFTQMNVWTHYFYWSKQYPKGPDDIICVKSQQKKRNETMIIDQDFMHAATDEEDWSILIDLLPICQFAFCLRCNDFNVQVSVSYTACNDYLSVDYLLTFLNLNHHCIDHLKKIN